MLLSSALEELSATGLHLRWKVENNAFGELTQHWHLTHCAHHHPVAVVALLWIKLLAFTLFHAFAILNGKLFRLGQVTQWALWHKKKPTE
jgi:hypothetical protein